MNKAEDASTVHPPRVFISYSWDSDEHKQWVEQLATQLRLDGVDARLDAWHLGDRAITSFMTSEVRRADFVLSICTPRYREKVHATEDGEGRTGSGWEAQIASSIQLTSNRNHIVPVLASGQWADAAPDLISGLQYFDLSRPETSEGEYRQLLQKLLGRNVKAPPLGMPPEPRDERLRPLFGGPTRESPQEPSGVDHVELARLVAERLNKSADWPEPAPKDMGAIELATLLDEAHGIQAEAVFRRRDRLVVWIRSDSNREFREAKALMLTVACVASGLSGIGLIEVGVSNTLSLVGSIGGPDMATPRIRFPADDIRRLRSQDGPVRRLWESCEVLCVVGANTAFMTTKRVPVKEFERQVR